MNEPLFYMFFYFRDKHFSVTLYSDSLHKIPNTLANYIYEIVICSFCWYTQQAILHALHTACIVCWYTHNEQLLLCLQRMQIRFIGIASILPCCHSSILPCCHSSTQYVRSGSIIEVYREHGASLLTTCLILSIVINVHFHTVLHTF